MKRTFFVASFLEPGSTLVSLSQVASVLQMKPLELLADAGVARDAAGADQSPPVQMLLRDLLNVLAAAMELCEHPTQAVVWLMDEPIASFRGKTAYQLAVEGRALDVVHYLASLESGFVG